jgi:hypothetical protein
MTEKIAAAPHAAFARVNQSARWNSRIIENRLGEVVVVMRGGTPALDLRKS